MASYEMDGFKIKFGFSNKAAFYYIQLTDIKTMDNTYYWYETEDCEKSVFNGHHVFQNKHILDTILYDKFDGNSEDITVTFNEEQKKLTIAIDIIYIQDTLELQMEKVQVNQDQSVREDIEDIEDELSETNHKITEMEKTIAELKEELVKQKAAFDKYVKDQEEKNIPPVTYNLDNVFYDKNSSGQMQKFFTMHPSVNGPAIYFNYDANGKTCYYKRDGNGNIVQC